MADSASNDWLPPLRRDLDFLPSSDPAQPGLILRDPMAYARAVLRVPALLVPALGSLDGRHGTLDCQAAITRHTGAIVSAEAIAAMIATLRETGFLATPEFATLRDRRQAEFAAAPLRTAAFAGSAYPADAGELRRTLAQYLAAAPQPAPAAARAGALAGLAAPHVSPFGGAAGYAAAYRCLPADLHRATLAILGTSHHGAPNRFGLTRKPFVTPLGVLAPDIPAVEFLLARAPAVCLPEDYCHAIEHTIEFQCIFAQCAAAHPPARILPVLCGPILDPAPLAAFFAALAALAAQRGRHWFWLLGVDLAHSGARYGSSRAVQAGDPLAREIERRDRERLAAVLAGDAGQFWRLAGTDITGAAGGLNWCGVSALYTFLRAVPRARGELLHYGQWNIDDRSLVSYAAMAWHEPAPAGPGPRVTAS